MDSMYFGLDAPRVIFLENSRRANPAKCQVAKKDDGLNIRLSMS